MTAVPYRSAPTPAEQRELDALLRAEIIRRAEPPWMPDLRELIAVAAALRCEGCGEPCGHTADCDVRPGKLRPHGSRAALVRHGRRGEEPCEKCRPRQEAAAA